MFYFVSNIEEGLTPFNLFSAILAANLDGISLLTKLEASSSLVIKSMTIAGNDGVEPRLPLPAEIATTLGAVEG